MLAPRADPRSVGEELSSLVMAVRAYREVATSEVPDLLKAQQAMGAIIAAYERLAVASARAGGEIASVQP